MLDAAECPHVWHRSEMVVYHRGGYRALVRSVEGAEDNVNAGIGEMDTQRVGPNDVVMGIAASGTTPFVRAARRARALGARTIFLSCSEPPALLKETCDICLTILVGPSDYRLHQDEGRDRHQARAQYRHDRCHGPAGEDLRQPDGGPQGGTTSSPTGRNGS